MLCWSLALRSDHFQISFWKKSKERKELPLISACRQHPRSIHALRSDQPFVIISSSQLIITRLTCLNLPVSIVQSLILFRVPTYNVWWSLFSVSGPSRYLSCVVVSILCIWSRRLAGSLTRYKAVLLDTRTSCTKQVYRSNRPRIFTFKPSAFCKT